MTYLLNKAELSARNFELKLIQQQFGRMQNKLVRKI